jgi:hypothetical protein
MKIQCVSEKHFKYTVKQLENRLNSISKRIVNLHTILSNNKTNTDNYVKLRLPLVLKHRALRIKALAELIKSQERWRYIFKTIRPASERSSNGTPKYPVLLTRNHHRKLMKLLEYDYRKNNK